jgi:hypothetical protein
LALSSWSLLKFVSLRYLSADFQYEISRYKLVCGSIGVNLSAHADTPESWDLRVQKWAVVISVITLFTNAVCTGKDTFSFLFSICKKGNRFTNGPQGLIAFKIYAGLRSSDVLGSSRGAQRSLKMGLIIFVESAAVYLIAFTIYTFLAAMNLNEQFILFYMVRDFPHSVRIHKLHVAY